MKKILSILIIVAIIGFGAYVYSTRPVSAPNESVRSATDTLKPMSNVTTVYRISQENSRAEFQMNELLYGKPKLVIGTTTQIAGDIAITNSHIDMGEFKIDARTFITDSTQRNNAINRLILKTGTAGNEYITFRPFSNDFKGAIVPGQSMTFNVDGELIIASVKKPATFKVTMMLSGDTLTGTAETKVKRADYNLVIPNLSFLANIDEEVSVIVNIMAVKVAQQ